MTNDGRPPGEVFGLGLLLEGVKGRVMVPVALGFLGDVVAPPTRAVSFLVPWKPPLGID